VETHFDKQDLSTTLRNPANRRTIQSRQTSLRMLRIITPFSPIRRSGAGLPDDAVAGTPAAARISGDKE